MKLNHRSYCFNVFTYLTISRLKSVSQSRYKSKSSNKTGIDGKKAVEWIASSRCESLQFTASGQENQILHWFWGHTHTTTTVSFTLFFADNKRMKQICAFAICSTPFPYINKRLLQTKKGQSLTHDWVRKKKKKLNRFANAIYFLKNAQLKLYSCFLVLVLVLVLLILVLYWPVNCESKVMETITIK